MKKTPSSNSVISAYVSCNCICSLPPWWVKPMAFLVAR